MRSYPAPCRVCRPSWRNSAHPPLMRYPFEQTIYSIRPPFSQPFRPQELPTRCAQVAPAWQRAFASKKNKQQGYLQKHTVQRHPPPPHARRPAATEQIASPPSHTHAPASAGLATARVSRTGAAARGGKGINTSFAIVLPTHASPTGKNRAPLRTRVAPTPPCHARHSCTTAQARTVHVKSDEKRVRSPSAPRHVQPSGFSHQLAPPHTAPTYWLCTPVTAARRRRCWAAQRGKR